MDRRATCRFFVALVLAVSFSAGAENIKIAYIDPLSGMMAATGDHGLRELQFVVERINAKGGANGQKFEVVPMDNKLSPQESLALLNRAVDEGIHYVFQGNGSSVAGALIDGINKNNERNPDKRVVFLNYAAVDPDFTNSKCSFWHFRFDANSDMKLQAIMSTMIGKKEIKKVYIIGQDYSFGHQVSKTAKQLLKEKRPDVELVGDELHPLAKVKDFAPYVAKIQASGADTVITGNWGSDLALLIRAARDAGLKAGFYTFYAGVVGAPTAIGEAGVDRVKVVSYYNPNEATEKELKFIEEFKKKYGATEDPYTTTMQHAMDLLVAAMNESKSTDPAKVARAMEGKKVSGYFGEIEMRKDDHQLIQPLYVMTFAKVDGKKVKFPADGTKDFGFRTDVKIDPEKTAMPTSCQMQRPQISANP
ncbi:MAG TPA: branched-chain amino acid ABC transporter substrate-binding protein [Myxococcales bacterium]|nr:branched-chain amino acid ABC transporter substrate-binding protein [Myxococcales bacterium]